MASPNNKIFWGQGSAMNQIGWGQGYVNNINWGLIHPNSWGHPETNLTGQSGDAYDFFYLQRVTAAGGYYEGSACAVAKIDSWL
jgi:hypothetical protein